MQNTDAVISETEWKTKELPEVQAHVSPGLHLNIKPLLPLDHSWGLYIWSGNRQKISSLYWFLIPALLRSWMSIPAGNTLHPELVGICISPSFLI